MFCSSIGPPICSIIFFLFNFPLMADLIAFGRDTIRAYHGHKSNKSDLTLSSSGDDSSKPGATEEDHKKGLFSPVNGNQLSEIRL